MAAGVPESLPATLQVTVTGLAKQYNRDECLARRANWTHNAFYSLVTVVLAFFCLDQPWRGLVYVAGLTALCVSCTRTIAYQKAAEIAPPALEPVPTKKDS